MFDRRTQHKKQSPLKVRKPPALARQNGVIRLTTSDVGARQVQQQLLLSRNDASTIFTYSNAQIILKEALFKDKRIWYLPIETSCDMLARYLIKYRFRDSLRFGAVYEIWATL